ncbi:MFS transporter [Chitinimonas lacunae]|uniref:MFS transporter n=1 Tax=Chitinimonas lacunae TaxID=1963018 RepID=A0ABV8MUK9_9NEIS
MSRLAVEEKPAGWQQARPAASWALASLSLAILLPSLGISIANIGLPTLAQAFAVSFSAVQWVVLAYLLAMTTLIVGVGRLGDLSGRRRLLLLGIVLFSGASLVCGLAPNLPVQIAARAVQGLGAAMMMALSMALVGETVPREKTGSVLGLLGTMSAIGTALGPSLGGVLIATFGWPAIFLIKVPLGLLAWWLAYRHLPPDPPAPERRARFDTVGMICLALTLLAYALAMTVERGSGLSPLLLLAALVGAGLFVLIERRTDSPLIELTMFRDLALTLSLLMSLLVATVLMATLVVGPFYLSRVFGLNAATLGLVVAAGPVVAALTATPAGRLVDRLGTVRMTLIGLGGIAGGAILLTFLPGRLGIPGYIVPIVLITANYALFQTANNTAVMVGIAASRRGLVSGLLNLSRNLGLISGTSLMGAVFSLAAGTTDLASASPEAITTAMRVTFTLAAGLIGLALVGALAVARQRRGRS